MDGESAAVEDLAVHGFDQVDAWLIGLDLRQADLP